MPFRGEKFWKPRILLIGEGADQNRSEITKI